MDTTLKESAITPTLGEVKPIDISSHGRRELDEKIVNDLEKAVARDGSYLHPPAVRDEGEGRYRLIHGHHRLEAWKRRRGEQTPIPANIYPSETPDARIELLETEENLFRKELTAAERTAQEMRWVAAFKKLNGRKPVTPVSGSDEAAESGNLIPISTRARRGRGNKGMAQQVADKFGISKRAVNMRRNSAAAVIGEEIDLDCDTPEELKRKAAELEKADKRQRAEPKAERPKRRMPAPRVEDPTPAESHAGEIDSQIEPWLKAFDTFGERYQFRLAYLVCIRLGLDPFMMAPPAVFGLADEVSELDVGLPAEVAPATDDAAVAHAEQRDDAVELGAEDLQVADDAAEDADDDGSEAADQEDIGAEDLQDDGDHLSEAVNQEPGGAAKCAYCNIPFESGDQLEEFNGKLYHGFCVEDGKKLAQAKQGKQIAIAA